MFGGITRAGLRTDTVAGKGKKKCGEASEMRCWGCGVLCEPEAFSTLIDSQ